MIEGRPVLKLREGRLTEPRPTDVFCAGCGLFMGDLAEMPDALFPGDCNECRRQRPLVAAAQESLRVLKRIEEMLLETEKEKRAQLARERTLSFQQLRAERERLRRSRWYRLRSRLAAWLLGGQPSR